MKYTNIQLQTHFDSLNSIASKVTGKLAYVVSRNARKISDELQEYNNIRNDKINEYGDEKDGQIGISYGSPNYQKFLNDMKEYDEVEVEINLIKVNPEDLYSSTLNAVEMDRLSFMINDEVDEV